MCLEIRTPGAELACLRSKPFTSRKQLAHHKMKNPAKRLRRWTARMSDKNRTTFPSKNTAWSPPLPDDNRLLLKEEGMLHNGWQGPVPTFLRCVASIKFLISGKMSHFQHLMYVRCSTENKIVYEIWKSWHSVFIYIYLNFTQHAKWNSRLMPISDILHIGRVKDICQDSGHTTVP